MKTRTIIFALSLILLAGCSPSSTTTSIEREITNPIVRSRYGDELADMLANIIIQNDPIVEKPGIRAILEREITKAKLLAKEGHDSVSAGTKGALLPMKADVQGGAVYVDDAVHFSTDFEIDPGINLHVYLTTTVDPRDVTFPDPTAVDLGPLQSAYGPQTYPVPGQDAAKEKLRTLVIWDNTLSYLYSFAQLSK